MQVSVVAETSFQNGRSSGRSSSSARSPVSVCAAHSRMIGRKTASAIGGAQSPLDRAMDADRRTFVPAAPVVSAAAERPAVDRRLRFTGQLIEAVQAQVVGAPLHVGGRERHAERGAQRRKVLEENLFLEVLGAGRDQHPLAAEDGGDEIRERLAGAGAGFGEQDAAVLERARDRGRPCRPGRRAARSPAACAPARRRRRTPAPLFR